MYFFYFGPVGPPVVTQQLRNNMVEGVNSIIEMNKLRGCLTKGNR
jgi:hypothetical protein